MKRHEKMYYFFMGIMIAAALMVLTGAANSSINYGRYQLSAWGSQFSDNVGGCGAFVTDTVTGETRVAYTIIYGTPDNKIQKINNLNKTFQQMR